MMMKKGFDVFVAIFVVISSKVCTACFSDNEYQTYIDKTGSTYIKNCKCDKVGYSVNHLIWLDPNGDSIEQNGPDTSNRNVYTEIQQLDGIKSLIVGSISKSMSGNYTCRTNFEGINYSKTYNIQAYDSSYFVNTSQDQNIIIGEDSLVRCEVRSTVDYLKDWYRLFDSDQVRINNDTKHIIIPPQGLLIKNVSKDDGGNYICTVTDMIDSNTITEHINVEVAVRPKIYEPKLNKPLGSIVSGDNLTVECIADGTPYPTYTWIKTTDSLGQPIENATSNWTQVVNTLKFDSIQKDDAGTYLCTASNKVDVASIKIFIDVKVPPEITSLYSVITSLDNVTEVVEGGPAQIVCKATGVPTPKLLISTDVVDLENDDRVSTNDFNTTDTSELYLSIVNVSTTFEGIYICSAANEVDNITQEMYLTVFYPPHFSKPSETFWGWSGYTVNMSCDHMSNPPSTIVWKFIGNAEQETTTAEHVQVNKILHELSGNITGHYLALQIGNISMYGEYECTASNVYGKTTKKIHLREAFKPSAIKNVTVINTTATSVAFLIEGPDNTDNAPVHGYLAEYDLEENYDTTSVHPSRSCDLSRNFTIDRLKPNSTYSIRFAAQNAVGEGNWSDPIQFVTPETSAPQSPVAMRGNQGKLRWDEPEANGDPIDHYSVEFCPFFGEIVNYTLCQKETVSDTEFPLDELERNTKYKFEVRAHNSHGYSDFTSEEITTPARLVNAGLLSAGTIIGLSVVVVFLCLLVLDLLLLCWKRQGVIASCFFRKNKKKKDNINSRDKKGLLVTDGDRADDRTNSGHRELVYNKTTGVITGKHSSV